MHRLLFAMRIDLDFRRMCCLNIDIIITSRVPVEGKSSVYVICLKYRIIVLIIIIISLGQILSYGTHIIHVRTRPPTAVTVHVVAVRRVSASNHDKVNAPFSPVRWP